jgi:hypothetical protein
VAAGERRRIGTGHGEFRLGANTEIGFDRDRRGDAVAGKLRRYGDEGQRRLHLCTERHI